MTDPTYGTVTITKRTSATTTTEVDPQVGEHVISSGLVRLNREWQPKDKASQRFKDDVIKKIEQVLNNTSTGSSGGGSSPGVEPDLFYDTGYFLINKNESVTKTHKLQQVPTRFTIFIANSLNPGFDPQNDEIYLVGPGVYKYGNLAGGYKWSGFTIRITGINTIVIKTQPDYVHGVSWESGFLRIMMWR